MLEALLAIRSSLLATSQWYGQEWQIVFLGLVYLYVMVRTNFLGEGPNDKEPRPLHRGDGIVGVLICAFVAMVAFGSPL